MHRKLENAVTGCIFCSFNLVLVCHYFYLSVSLVLIILFSTLFLLFFPAAFCHGLRNVSLQGNPVEVLLL